MKKFLLPSAQRMQIVAPITFLLFVSAPACSQTNNYEFNDSHFHLTNNIQEGPNIHEFLNMMGTKAGRVAIFGVPLQQQWSNRTDGDRAPTYYLHSDAPLYYYSFTDASIAMAYSSLTKEQQARFDPMITGFNPTDMYAADHIRRVLDTFPGVFTGIGEFVVHKEFVTAKIPGEVASLRNPALDRVLDFAAEVGLIVILHNDIDIPFASTVTKPDTEPAYLNEIKALFKRHPNTNDYLGAYRPWPHSRACDKAPCAHRSDPARSRLPQRLYRHLLGRSRQIYRRHPRGHQAMGRSDPALSGSLFVRHGFRRAH